MNLNTLKVGDLVSVARSDTNEAWERVEDCAKRKNLEELRKAIRAIEEKDWLK